MWNYPDGMRESDIPGWNEVDGVRCVTCNATDVEMKFVDPDTIDFIAARTKNYLNSNNPWHAIIAIRNLKQIGKLIEDAPKFLVDCDFNDDVDGIYSNNYFYWQCPKCMTEHEEYINED